MCEFIFFFLLGLYLYFVGVVCDEFIYLIKLLLNKISVDCV